MAEDPFHTRLLEIVRRLPEAVEDWPWGSIHCKVAGKIFVGWGRDQSGEMSIGIRTTLELQSMLVNSDPRFSIAKYVGKYGGIDMCLGKQPDWREVEELIIGSYRIIAPKRLVRQLDAEPDAAAPKRTAAKKKSASGKQPSAKKKATKKAAGKKAAKR